MRSTGQSVDPYRVLFVCTANICRSAYAEVAARTRTSSAIEFGSAGIYALVGQPMDAPIAAYVTGGGGEGIRARQLTRQHLSQADLVLAMAPEHRRFIIDEWPGLSSKTFVIGHVARELARLPDHVTLERLVQHLWSHRTAEPDDGVPDPYSLGEAAAEQAARRIDGLLEMIVTRLERLVDAGSPRA